MSKLTGQTLSRFDSYTVHMEQLHNCRTCGFYGLCTAHYGLNGAIIYICANCVKHKKLIINDTRLIYGMNRVIKVPLYKQEKLMEVSE